MSRTISKSHIVQGCVFIVVLGMGLYAMEVGKNLHDRNQNLRQQQLLPRIAAQIETALTHSLAAAHTLEQEVKRGNGKFSDFDSYAAKMMHSFPEVASFLLAPSGIVTEKYPSSSGYIAIGTNVMTHRRSSSAARESMERAELVLTKPFSVNEHDNVVQAWNPVYLSGNAIDRFWGFTSVTVSINNLLSKTDLSEVIEMNAAYQIVRVDPNTGEESTLYSVGEWEQVDRISTEIILPHDNHWELRIATCTTIKQWQLLLGYLLSLLIAWSAAAFFRSAETGRIRLSQLVARKTSELNHIAFHDSLTGLPNHRHFYGLLDSELAHTSNDDNGLAVVLVDLDLFSEVNDAFGQHGGDTLLKEAATRIVKYLPESATVARWGDDKFILLTKNLSADKIETVVAQISHEFCRPCIINGSEVTVSACIGVALTGCEATCANDVLSWAEQALDSAKSVGKNEICWYSENMRRKCKRRLTLLADLKTAIVRQQLELYFQPIVAGRTGRVDKAECLLRWKHPTLKMVSPAEFVPIAEETGLIREIGDWVFEQSVLRVKRWREEYNPEFCLSVNVSPVQLNRPGTVRRWLTLLQEHDVPSAAILIEITEGILLEHNTAAYAQIEELRAAGLQLALDDFGTGYSSMSYLKVFDIDYIKIDRSFVSNLTESRQDMILCDAIIAIADKMNIKVVAEGVETLDQHRLLTAAGCDYSQGYYFSKPVSSYEFVQKFLQERRAMVA